MKFVIELDAAAAPAASPRLHFHFKRHCFRRMLKLGPTPLQSVPILSCSRNTKAIHPFIDPSSITATWLDSYFFVILEATSQFPKAAIIEGAGVTYSKRYRNTLLSVGKTRSPP